MFILILFLVAGSLLVYISKFNLMPVTVNLKFYTFSNVPLIFVIIGSILVGLVFSYLIYLIRAISTSLKLRGKNKEIKKEKDQVLELTKRVHQLELENEKLKHGSDKDSEDSNSL
ncbi:MAG: hypothetical protein UV71_C0012G0026 [Microgenomates group bacterium GW2011_GWC1_43_13]|uniref:Lipopolysaccharide assembly protein A domain-containing protein n=3 Tax=Candidatus Woeseibacteriota TaxID=1752722 RepID=A0A837IFS2_9BACT|nr:MAG: hypothetical protein UV71_C0012G0026 [Microgenomates group bacterium GW2011_GWC1_43_13]KKT33105.1 MAG: hypothetical protein UW20_C0005G0037 [Candidatus Woesebacteria bacterium GW2011_GWB1_44_11]KKT54767.1 MAG: hypothetical protein UW47_C0003G0036 [Candidatus Woesebacteria bacterium GW2011_GWA1_44_23]OGM76325.1 MAG: hypothetical protein A2208_01090 [Candidatus Woesebacteria bacterium RIFOXYA1_FULL_43_16]OGM81542.1 MAG: hypothetical protein A2394_01100 [Candidatus Woesebacteria bacterium 